MEDIRWKQRFSNYIKALDKLKRSVEYVKGNFEFNEAEGNKKSEKILEEIVRKG